MDKVREVVQGSKAATQQAVITTLNPLIRVGLCNAMWSRSPVSHRSTARFGNSCGTGRCVGIAAKARAGSRTSTSIPRTTATGCSQRALDAWLSCPAPTVPSWRWRCPKFLRQTFVEWAAQTINKSFWAGAYYRQQRNKGCSHHAAVRSLAFKWIRILYRSHPVRRVAISERAKASRFASAQAARDDDTGNLRNELVQARYDERRPV